MIAAAELHSFAERVCRRLAAGAAEYGDRSYGRPLAELLAEQMEEAADVAAWGEIASTVLADADLTSAQRSEVALAIAVAQAQAREVWNRLRRALETLDGTESER